MGRRWWVVFVLICVALGACSSSTSQSSASISRDVAPGWVEVRNDSALYLAWINKDGELNGTMQIARLAVSGLSVEPTTRNIAGQQVGSAISLTVEGVVWQGSIHDDLLTLNIPQRDGTIEPSTLRPGDIEAFNDGVRDLQSAAAAVVTASSEAQVRADHDAAVAAATTDLADDVRQLRQARARLAETLQTYNLGSSASSVGGFRWLCGRGAGGRAHRG